MDTIAQWLTVGLSQYVSKEFVVFFISLLPLLELRGGLLASKLLGLTLLKAIPICIIGNIIPIPFILLFIKKIFKWLKKFKLFRGLIEKLETKAMGKSDKIKRYEFWGLVLFVGIPLPGTGAWTGALLSVLLGMKPGKSFICIMLGVMAAGLVMSLLSFGIIKSIF